MKILLVGFFALVCAAQELRVYAIDVEGGKATLYVSPSGQSMLVDAGYAGNKNRDANRIAAAAKAAGVKQIDFLVATHYHKDHVGGVPQLVAKMPVRNFVDHGSPFEDPKADGVYEPYVAARAKGKHIEVKAGDRIPIEGLETPRRVTRTSGSFIWPKKTIRNTMRQPRLLPISAAKIRATGSGSPHSRMAASKF